MTDLQSRLNNRILILDGAMGTMLQAKGLPAGMCPELFGLENPSLLEDIHYQYVQAGADIIGTNTFGANIYKLTEFGLAERIEEINTSAVIAAKKAAGGRALAAGSMGPTGKLLAPMGELEFDDLYRAYAQQAAILEQAGADLISLETMTDIGEMRAALIAVKDNTRLPVLVHMTYESDGRTMMGTDPLTALVILQALQPLAIGANCSGGAKELLPLVEIMRRYSSGFLTVEPNAGLPQLVGGNTVFPDSPEEMAEYALRLRAAGANIIGGCCGTTPQHIQAMAQVLKGMTPNRGNAPGVYGLASRSRHVLIGPSYQPAFIGERINPTARPKLAQAIKEGRMEEVVKEAKAQTDLGVPILDVNMGVGGIDEARAMKQSVAAIQAAADVPIVIDSTDLEAMEAGLKSFVGRPLINSTTGEQRQMDKVLPLAKRYGAAVLGLCLDENGIPEKAEERVDIARRIYEQARAYGLRDEDIYIDCLVKTAGAEQSQVMETIKALQQVKAALPVKTVLGVSNVSHGLPGRDIINATYLAFAWSAGVDLPIINPFVPRIMETVHAAAVLMCRDPGAAEFINRYKNWGSTSKETEVWRHNICGQCNIPEIMSKIDDPAAGQTEAKSYPQPPVDNVDNSTVLELIKQAILNGNQDGIEDLLHKALHQEKIDPMLIVNQGLIPGIERAGELYESKQFFLPQLMLAAKAMQKAFALVRPGLSEAAQWERGTIVLATVEGDIHDIGKNIVAVLLENYGFKVIDLGKNVNMKDILDAAEREQADIIGLSALMTTTMPRMGEIIAGAKARNLKCKIMVGGAVLTRDYAEQIGADAYSKDARAAIIDAQRILELY